MPKVKTSQLTPDEPVWISAPYVTGWGDYGGEWGGVWYMKDSLGFVYMKGLVKNTSGAVKAAGSTIMNMPVGFRPNQRLRFITFGVGAGGGAAQQLDILADGSIQSPTAAVPSTEWLSFSGITYRADQ